MCLKATKIYARFASEVYDDFGESDYEQEYYRKEHVDKAMNALKKKNADLRHNLEDWKAENEALKQRIKELEETKLRMYDANQLMNAHIKELDAIAEKQTKLSMDRWFEIKRLKDSVEILKEQCTKYQAELMNNDPALNDTPKWISVKDRLPNEYGDYLVVHKNCDDLDVIDVFAYAFDTKQGYACWVDDFEEDTSVTHWMLLPPPPSIEEDKSNEKI